MKISTFLFYMDTSEEIKLAYPWHMWIKWEIFCLIQIRKWKMIQVEKLKGEQNRL